MFVNILKFVGVVALLYFVSCYVPFGEVISGIVGLVALWKLVNG